MFPLLKFLLYTGILMWVVGILIEFSSDNETCHAKWVDSKLKMVWRNKRHTTKDVWWSIIWPLRLFYFIITGILSAVNYILALILLGIGINYLYSYTYKEIQRRLS